MDFKVVYTKPALDDLKSVLSWSWEKHPGTTQRFADSLLKHIGLLKDFPYLGAPVRGYPAVRRILHSPLQVYYRIHEEKGGIEILHLWHAAREQPKL